MELINHCERLNRDEESKLKCITNNLFGPISKRDYFPFETFNVCEKITDKIEMNNCIDKCMISWLSKRGYYDTAYAFKKAKNNL
jgi:hypothetical protein